MIKITAQFDDEMLPEYDFSQLGQPVRGKHAKAMHQGYSCESTPNCRPIS